MNKLKLFGLSLLLAPALALAGVSSVQASDPLSAACTGKASASAACQPSDNGNPIIHLINVAINIIALVGGVIAVIMIFLGALAFITSGGNADSVNKARSQVLGALLGLVIIALSWTIVHFIVSVLL